jgi:Domain of unknown function (DUF222)
MDVSRIARLVDSVERDPDASVSGGQMEELFELHARLESAMSSAFVAFERSGEWGADGAKTATAWVRTTTRRRHGAVARLRRLGVALRTMEVTATAWSSGAISADHVEVLARLHGGVTEAPFERDEELLVGFARTLTFREFERAVDYWRLHADPDGAEDGARAREDGRRATLGPSFAGSWMGQFDLDPVGGEIFSSELDRICDLLYEDDRAEARARLGREPLDHELGRTPVQRRADALVEMALRSASTPESAQRPRPLVTFLVGYEHYGRPVCELASGTVVTPGTVARHLAEADLELALFRSQRRVEISATVRLFTGATRRAIEVRDGQCRHPFCDRPAPRCQIDHIIPYARGGPSTQANGRVYCSYHNRLRNRAPFPEDEGRDPPIDPDIEDYLDHLGDHAGPVVGGRPPPDG